MNLDNYITTKQAGEIIGRHESTIQRWCIKGEIEGAVKIGYKWAVPTATAEALAKVTPTQKEQLAINGRESVKARRTIKAKNQAAPRKNPDANKAMMRAIEKRMPAQEELLACIAAMGRS